MRFDSLSSLQNLLLDPILRQLNQDQTSAPSCFVIHFLPPFHVRLPNILFPLGLAAKVVYVNFSHSCYMTFLLFGEVYEIFSSSALLLLPLLLSGFILFVFYGKFTCQNYVNQQTHLKTFFLYWVFNCGFRSMLTNRRSFLLKVGFRLRRIVLCFCFVLRDTVSFLIGSLSRKCLPRRLQARVPSWKLAVISSKP